MGTSFDKLMHIQTEIKAPKNLYNSFGKYNYRNAESICEAVKPFLTKYGCSLVLTDEVQAIGERIYVKANAQLIDNETGLAITTVSALAREPKDKKGMDDSQITGTASSYARKYALNGLFLLDDTKDADSDEYAKQTGNGKGTSGEKTEAEMEADGKSKISDLKVKALEDRCNEEGVAVEKILTLYKVKELKGLSEKQFANIHANWDKIKAM